VPVLAACGASSAAKTSPSTTVAVVPRLTQKDFVKEGNLVCLHSDRRVYKLGTLSRNPAGWEKVAQAASTAIAEMKKLRPPAADQVGFDRLLLLAHRLVNGIGRVHAALMRREFTAARTDQTVAKDVSAQIHAQARKLGLTFCQQLLTNWPA
jgi:outer membrane receptor for monomeric catechols